MSNLDSTASSRATPTASLADYVSDIQINILRGLPADRATYYFLAITDSAKFRQTLCHLTESDSFLHSEAERPKRGTTTKSAINVAFALEGLRALGDVGDSAPENWDGMRGSRSIHAVVALYGHEPERYQDDCQQLETNQADKRYRVLHVESGFALFNQDEQRVPYRIEHFGFRDGISQPYVYLGDQRPYPGGGKRRHDDRWAPIAPGEFILGHRDEDDVVQPAPENAELRRNGTYLVFRKLSQDVVGFRDFLANQRDDLKQRDRLAAQMIGRWPNGAPLVRSPEVPREFDLSSLNDFRYEAEDPDGRRCPFGSHVRRRNPRDTGNREDANRHRLIRRGIPYGTCLPEGNADDGQPRGLLFVAYNARIDLQFEFLQRQWVNRGEFVVQEGNRKDPIIGANSDELADQFIIPGQPAPVFRLPRFVAVKGGDYFFVPGVAALRELARVDSDGKLNVEDLKFRSPQRYPNLGIAKSPELFDSDHLKEIGQELLQRQSAPTIATRRVPLIDYPGAPAKPQTIAIVAKRHHVEHVLCNDDIYQVTPYAHRIEKISGNRMMVGMQSNDPEREKRLELLHAAVKKAGTDHISGLVRQLTSAAIDRLRPYGKFDIVKDIGRVVPVGLPAAYFGVAGPGWVSPTAIAAKFGKRDIGDVPRDWLRTLDPMLESEEPLTTMQSWTRFAFLEIFVNIQNAAELTELAERSIAELLQHIDAVVSDAESQRSIRIGDGGGDRDNPEPAATLLDHLVDLSQEHDAFGLSRSEYLEHTRLLLAEMTVGGIETVNKALTNVVDFLLDQPQVLATLIQAAKADADDVIDAVIREILRFEPVSPALFRRCSKTDEIEPGESIEEGSVVCLLLQVAGFDPQPGQKSPMEFDAQRPKESYLQFGLAPHYCGGAELAEVALREIVKQIVQLPNLRRAAGPSGEKQEFLKLADSLCARFDPY